MSTTGADSTEDVAARDEIGFNVVASGPDYRGIRQALGELFAGDGTVVLVSGYFTYNGFLGIKDDIEAFLNRSPENELVVVVGTASDQFSPRIATDLWELDPGDRVRIYKYPLGLHAKLYLRDGPNPRMILTSANITQVGFRYNVELGIEFAAEGGDHPYLVAYRQWAEELVAASEPLTRRDLFFPIQVTNTIVNWTNKGRLLPRQYVIKRVARTAMIVIGAIVLIRVI